VAPPFVEWLFHTHEWTAHLAEKWVKEYGVAVTILLFVTFYLYFLWLARYISTTV